MQKDFKKYLRVNMTDAEKKLWYYLRAKRFNGLKFKRQEQIDKYIVDFVCYEHKLVIEIDGSGHMESAQANYDLLRDKYLKEEGFKVLRFFNSDVFFNIESVLTKILYTINPLSCPSDTLSRKGRGENVDSLSNIVIQCPAKINLTLKITGRREDGFHNIDSVMQTISLYDYLTISVDPSQKFDIKLSGTSSEIPYNEKNIVYKAVLLFAERTNLSPHTINIFIEKNIPVSAGLAGGSTNAAGTLWGLNKLFNEPLSKDELHNLCAKLGSDLNFCLEGGRKQTLGRGEIIKPLEFKEFNVSLIKPIDLGISAKEAYTKYAGKIITENISADKKTPHLHSYVSHNSTRTASSPSRGEERNREDYVNDLEWAVIDDYQQLQKIKELYPNSIMSGSGSTYYLINECFKESDGYQIINNLKAVPFGITEKNRPC